ncbi:MAG: UbiA prenyltransferase family protein [Planctomycetes bacterium]|nr:UbiA prenyltransferase family protein [Planctomycetia bacterium]MBI3468261.1 UbiA prenyltransferase family protein [Planctomycetota bacterium]
MTHLSEPGDSSLPTPASQRTTKALWAYVAIARPDHWFKNVFMLLGAMLALFYYPAGLTYAHGMALAVALVATCLVASSNYVLNEILDAPSDRAHPLKRTRPVPSGRVWLPLAYVEWLGLGALGLWTAYWANGSVCLAGAALWFMGLTYNVRPLRLKDLPYLDVLSESINNPIRLLLGWFVLLPGSMPPVSLLAAYWMLGAFFMASKRFGEYRSLADPQTAAAYRRSFRFYDEPRLLVSMFFYASGAALLLGVFIIRYHLELILAVPLIAGCFSYYLHIALKRDSAAQHPERLYHETGLMIYLLICLAVFVGLMFVEMPLLYDLFNVSPSQVPALWRF